MKSITVEYLRFGDPTGVIRLSDSYIRTVGNTAPAQEVSFDITQENLNDGMDTLDYRNFKRAPNDKEVDAVRRTAEHFLEDITPYLKSFLLKGAPKELKRSLYRNARSINRKKRFQIDIVTRALELAQLPFEILEEIYPNLVITRRFRQAWPLPEVVRDDKPRVLFAWAEPKRTARSSRRMTVPHDRHEKLLRALLNDWGDGAVEPVENATKQKLKDRLTAPRDQKDRFTHVHLLAHGEARQSSTGSPERIDLMSKPDPSIFLALEDEDGTLDLCSPEELAEIFSAGPRPETFALATCYGARVDPIRSGATFAHILHRAGIPIVLASQIALTKFGSDELIHTFLAGVIKGIDPRVALRDCRDALRKSAKETYYDRVALVGYIHVDQGLEERLKERKFKTVLARLNAISKGAEDRIGFAQDDQRTWKGLTKVNPAEAEEIRRRFTSVRNDLNDLESDNTLTKQQREELHGLRGSSLKREAEAAWKLSRVLAGDDSRSWLEHSRSMLREAKNAYRQAAEVSRDHHWPWVEWLVLEAVAHGSLEDHAESWIVANAAARDATGQKVPKRVESVEKKNILLQAIWGWGSLSELNLLAPLVGRDEAIREAKYCLDQLVKKTRKYDDEYPITTTLCQLNRYRTWWGGDTHWKLPNRVIAQAKELHDHLKAKSEAK